MRTMVLFLIGLLVEASALYGAEVKVVKVEGETISIGIGMDRGVKVGMKADVFQQVAPLIHPVTGKDLGSPKVKIATIEIRKVGPNVSEARYLVEYVPVAAGDLVEGLDVGPTPEEKLQSSVADARSEIKAVAQSLADEIKSNQKAIADLRGTLRRIGHSEVRLRTLNNSVKNLLERMVVVEAEVGSLQVKQQVLIRQDTAEVKQAEVAPVDMHQLRVIRRDSDEAVYIQVGNQRYRLSFEQNALVGVQPAVAAAGTLSAGSVPAAGGAGKGGGKGLDEDLFSEGGASKASVPWYRAYWWVGPIVGVLAAVFLLFFKALKRQRQQTAGTAETDEGEFMEAADEELIPEPVPEPDAAESLERET